MNSTIVGFFDDRTQAEQARMKLLDLGLPDGSIQALSADTAAQSAQDLTFGERVKNFFMGVDDFNSNPDLHYYAEGVRRGGTSLTVTADESQIDRVADCLIECGSIDIDRRSQYFKESGFSSYDFNAKPFSANESSSFKNEYSDWEKNKFSGQDTVVPVVEENVNIEKRAVETGRVRVHTHVTETPVEKELKLRKERVEVERSPVDRAVNAADMEAFKDGEIEMRETAEEAVVNKEARVVEEVRLKKQSEERAETVRETARRTDVDVDRSDVNVDMSPKKKSGRRSSKDITDRT